jgi:cephalosporin hydroxylase
VTLGSFFIVEDSIIHHGVDEGPNPGPYEAIEEFMKDNTSFQIDRTKESFFITHNPKGFLVRIR